MEGKAKATAMEPNNDVILSEHRLKQESIVKEEIQVQCNDTITEQENYKIELMRAVVEKKDPSSKVLLYYFPQHCSISLSFYYPC